MHRAPDRQGVLELAEQLVHCWPRDWKPPQPKDTDGFNLLFWGNHTPNNIVSAITRASLYADRIFVVNPFTDLLLYHPQHSPLLRPEAWTVQYAQFAVFFSMLEPWIRADIVEVVNNPACFSAELLDAFARQWNSWHNTLPRNERQVVTRMAYLEGVVENCLQTPAEAWRQILSLMRVPKSEWEYVIRVAKDVLYQDPVRAAIPLPIREGSQITLVGSGMSYDHASAIGSAHGASIFTQNELLGRILRMKSSELVSPFQKAAQAFSQMKLSFLNIVPTDFAVGLRQDGTLRSFRSYLGSLAQAVDLRTKEPGGASDFKERLLDEYNRYLEEWKAVQTKLSGRAFFAIPAGGFAAVLTGTMSVIGALGATMAAEVLTLLDAVYERRTLQRKPLNVMLRLDHIQRQK